MNFSNNNCGCGSSSNGTALTSSRSASAASLVYLDKVYFDETQNSCPLINTLTTTPEIFSQHLNVTAPVSIKTKTHCYTGDGCRCKNNCDTSRSGSSCRSCCPNGCSDFELTESTVFNITNSWVNVNSFRLSSDTGFSADDVTIDGRQITELTQSSGRFNADISGIIDELTNCRNQGHFFLAQVPGPWVLNGSIVVEGTVSNGSSSCCFNLCMETLPDADGGDGGYTLPGSDNFALYNVAIPCRTRGISPTLSFSFDACASLLNPAITVTTDDTDTVLTLSGTLVITPQINLQVVKPALFSLNAPEIRIPCDTGNGCSSCESEIVCCSNLKPCEKECSEAISLFELAEEQTSSTSANTAANDNDCDSCSDNSEEDDELPYCCPEEIRCQCCDTNGYSF